VGSGSEANYHPAARSSATKTDGVTLFRDGVLEVVSTHPMEDPQTTADDPGSPNAADQSAPHGWQDIPPPHSWARGAPPPPVSGVDLTSLLALLDGLRRAAPPELQARLTALTREVLLTTRSLIDWSLERLDEPQPEPDVEDAPIG